MRKGLLFLFVFSQASFAANYYCPNTSRYISTGQTAEVVEQNCGAPTKKINSEKQAQKTVKIQQWFYNFTSGPDPKTNNRPDTVFTIQDGKVTGITLNNQPVDSTAVCDGKTILKIGDSGKQVKAICKGPGFTNVGEKTQAGKKSKIMQWIYIYGPYQPQVILEFEEGKLTSIKQGQP